VRCAESITHASFVNSRADALACRLLEQAFSPAHVNSAFMAVGAYPSTWEDVKNSQVRAGANDTATMLKLDNNETVSQHLRALLETRGLAEAVKVVGLWDGIGEHSNTWKRADGTREWRLREVFINENPTHRASGSTGACSRPACWLSHPVLCAATSLSFCESTYRYTQGTCVFHRCS
jgi:hypothetical protein